MAKVNQINLGPIERAAKNALRDLAFLYGQRCTEVISEPGAFSSPEDIVDTGNLRASQQVNKVSDTEWILSWGADYSLYVHNGYTLRNGTEVEGRPWTKEAEKRLNPAQTFETLMKANL